MNFQELQYHIEPLGCSIDHLEGDSYWASNCINGHMCIIENLSDYSEVTLCHYFYELGVSAPPELRESYEAYAALRKNISTLIPQQNEDEE